MKKSQALFLFLTISIHCFAQSDTMDTIFMNNEKVVCSVKEVSEDAVKYVYPGEETINTVYKNAIQKIVFRSGRVSIFAESTSYKKVTCVGDYDNVSFAHVGGEVKGLYKLGEVSSKARGVTVFADMERVKERAMFKLKVEAAMMGANVILLTQEATSGNHYGYYANNATATNMAGIAYSNVLPSYTDFVNLVNDRTNFNVSKEVELDNSSMDYTETPKTEKLHIDSISNVSGLIMVRAAVDNDSEDTFRVISFTSDSFILVVSDENAIYNLKVDF